MPGYNKSSSLPTPASNGPSARQITFEPPTALSPPLASAPRLPSADNKELSRSKTAPQLKRTGTATSKRSNMSARSIYAPTEEELWDAYDVHKLDEEENEPDFLPLMTPKLVRQITKSLTSSQRKDKLGRACADFIFEHWFLLKLLQHTANNPHDVMLHSVVNEGLEVTAELLAVEPSIEEYVDGLCTVCTVKSGGVWDIDQKLEIMMGVYGVTKVGYLNRDEFAELLKKHALVVLPPPPIKFASEEEELDYERKVKRGEITPAKHMTQHEYELFLYRWLKKSFATWPTVKGLKSGPHVAMKDVVEAIEGNSVLADHFTVNLYELMKDIAKQDEVRKIDLKYVSISEEEAARYRELLETQDPVEAARLRKEEGGGEDFSMMEIPGVNIRRGSSAGKKKRSGTAKGRKGKKK